MKPQKATRKRNDLISVDDEQTVLGGILINSDAIEDVERVLKPADFAKPEHQRLYTLIGEMVREGPTDIGAVIAAAEDRGISEYGGAAYLWQMPTRCPALDAVQSAGRRVRDLAIRREVHQLSATIREAAHVELSIEDMLAVVEHGASELRRGGTGPAGFRDASSLAGESLTALGERMANGGIVPGMSTGLRRLDEVMGGFHRGHLVILAARPAMGKTALSICLSLNIARHTPTAIIELEMRDEALMRRMLANVGGVESDKVKTGQLSIEEIERVNDAADHIGRLDLYVDDTPGVTVSQIRARVRRLKQACPNLGLVVVDYLQIVKPEGRQGANRSELVGEMSMALKHMAREFDVCVLALSQLNRDLEKRDDKRPMLADLRDSGALEQDADTVLFLYRDEVYDEHTEARGIAELAIAKQRDGCTGKVWLAWNGSLQRFSILDRGEPYVKPEPVRMASVKRFPGGKGRRGGGDDE